jgi:hydroxyethylthiazole kinase-like uncharacterized protein yjeF
MKGLLSCGASLALDAATTDRLGLPSILLMEDASLLLWEAAKRLLPKDGRGPIVALCGSGNNAGDALGVLRRARFEGEDRLAAILGAEKLGPNAEIYARTLVSLGVPVLSWQDRTEECRRLIEGASVLIDGIAGTGLHGALRGALATLVEIANGASAPILSVDLPSGLRDDFAASDPIVKARWTLAIEPVKAACYLPAARDFCGEILPVGAVFPTGSEAEAKASLLEPGDLRDLAPVPPSSAYKMTRGRVAAFAGSVGAMGAATLASRAALASGAGYVALFASPDILMPLSTRLESVMVKPRPEKAAAFDATRWDAILAGPGWGLSEANGDMLEMLLATDRTLVLDADAIRLLRTLGSSRLRRTAATVLSPHPGEFSELTGLRADEALSKTATILPEISASLGAFIVLKSHVTWIAAPDGRTAVWDGMECGLGTAGSGDVLAGLMAGLLASAFARGEADPFPPICAAVLAHGLAGRKAREGRGWFEAGVLVEEAARLLGSLE